MYRPWKCVFLVREADTGFVHLGWYLHSGRGMGCVVMFDNVSSSQAKQTGCNQNDISPYIQGENSYLNTTSTQLHAVTYTHPQTILWSGDLDSQAPEAPDTVHFSQL